MPGQVSGDRRGCPPSPARWTSGFTGPGNLSWTQVRLSRSGKYDVPGVEQLRADVLDPASIEAAVDDRTITHLVFTTWQRQDTEAENIRVNGAMLRNTLDMLGRTTQLSHAVLVTGLKHYLGPFEAYTKTPATPFRERQDRLPYEKFYYTQEASSSRRHNSRASPGRCTTR